MDHQVEFRVLGSLEIVVDGKAIKLDAPRQRAVLAMLLVHANEVVSSDQLLEAVWGEQAPGTGVSSLRYHVSKLREALPADLIATRAPGYVLEVETSRIDALVFESSLAEARAIRESDPASALKLLHDAIGLWRGGAYADFMYEEFAHLEVERLEELRRAALEERLEVLLAMGRHNEMLPELEKLTAEYPTRERLWGNLALALYRSGRQAEAVAAIQQARSQLGDVGLDLSPQLRELEDQILTQDPSLLVEVATPERLRGYTLRGLIGEGAHGVVWRAAQPGVGREVAIKAIRPELANRPKFVRRFEAEAQLVAALEHPHIVSLFDFWRDPNGAYLVMPCLRGSLADRLEQGPLEPEAALQLLREVGAALTYAHRRGVVHRDVTPHNVLLDEDGNAYLADFGVATLLGEAAVQYVEGTPSAVYLSPELLAGERGTPASDVFSLG
ncbi:MAG: BTAD domain-containing putative transcriptional regulator, partial [Acidimicrobiia bacterium]|nr:BTAD domain-containing putative transcriptional regulator [Acidimicrobiia bacterium]